MSRPRRAGVAAGGTVMQFVGDATLAVFPAPVPADGHSDQAIAAAVAMHEAQDVLNERWRGDGRSPFGLDIGISTGVVAMPFGLDIGISTGVVAAAVLGSSDRLE